MRWANQGESAGGLEHPAARRIRRWLWLGLSTGLATGGSSWGLEPEKLLVLEAGPLTIRPQFAFGTLYNDNVLYQRPAEAQSDVVGLASPGVNLELGLTEKKVHLNFDYVFDQAFYVDNDDLNSGNHTFALTAAVDTDRLKIEGQDRFALLGDVLGGSTALYRRVERMQFYDYYRVEYVLSPKTAVFATGQFNATDYSAGTPLYDYNSWRGSAGFGYRPRAKVFFFGELYYGQSATTPNFAGPKGPHMEFMGGFLGARGNFTPRINGTVKAGYEVRQFADNTEVPGAPVVDATLEYRMSEKRHATFAYRRITGVSVQSASESYTVDGVEFGLTQFVGPQRRLSVQLAGSFSLYDFGDSRFYTGREDLAYNASVGSKYLLRKWCSLGLNYQYESFSSSFQGIVDYDVNRITLRVLVGY